MKKKINEDDLISVRLEFKDRYDRLKIMYFKTTLSKLMSFFPDGAKVHWYDSQICELVKTNFDDSKK